LVDDDVAQSHWRLALDDEGHDVVAGWKRESQRTHRWLADWQWIAAQFFAVARSLIVQIKYVLVFGRIFVTDIPLLPGDRKIFSCGRAYRIGDKRHLFVQNDFCRHFVSLL
jgi:hypothetical protein